MPRPRKIFDVGTSADIITSNVPVIPVADEREVEEEQEASPVKTTLDLSLFTRFDASYRNAFRYEGLYILVGRRGEVHIPGPIAERLSTGQVEIYLNHKGTILVVRQVEYGGLPLRKKGKGKKVHCVPLVRRMAELGVDLPAVYDTEWDDELDAWVCRIRRKPGDKKPS